jgi:hypothetical protein
MRRIVAYRGKFKLGPPPAISYGERKQAPKPRNEKAAPNLSGTPTKTMHLRATIRNESGGAGLNPGFVAWSCVVSWSLRFAEPIVLEDGSKLATLRDAIRYLAQIIPKAEHDMLEVLTASDLLTQAATMARSSSRVSLHCRRSIVTSRACSIHRAKIRIGGAASWRATDDRSGPSLGTATAWSRGSLHRASRQLGLLPPHALEFFG